MFVSVTTAAAFFETFRFYCIIFRLFLYVTWKRRL